ncbi:VWA domain-containing protein [Streptomyces sp. NPDC050535]|uniref:VWA domain-containing protein n=1 Tax=Streptomyces sp. NPDC050535 TaxID=3365626 RepID=UPI0037897416
MTVENAHPSEGELNAHKGRTAASVAARRSGVPRNSTRVVLALPGAHRYPFEAGTVADVVRRAAVLGDFLSPTSDVDSWIYTSRAHRLPVLRLPDAARWIADWGVLPPEALLTQDAVPANLLARESDRYGLFGTEDAAAAVEGIAAGLPEDGVPVLVLFFFWGLHSEGPALADQLDAASGRRVFWQFLGDTGAGSSVLDDLDALRSRAPHIQNVSLYRGWESMAETPEYLFHRAVLKPFARWRKSLARVRP